LEAFVTTRDGSNVKPITRSGTIERNGIILRMVGVENDSGN
jgi:hypothetical protein